MFPTRSVAQPGTAPRLTARDSARGQGQRCSQLHAKRRTVRVFFIAVRWRSSAASDSGRHLIEFGAAHPAGALMSRPMAAGTSSTSPEQAHGNRPHSTRGTRETSCGRQHLNPQGKAQRMECCQQQVRTTELTLEGHSYVLHRCSDCNRRTWVRRGHMVAFADVATAMTREARAITRARTRVTPCR